MGGGRRRQTRSELPNVFYRFFLEQLGTFQYFSMLQAFAFAFSFAFPLRLFWSRRSFESDKQKKLRRSFQVLTPWYTCASLLIILRRFSCRDRFKRLSSSWWDASSKEPTRWDASVYPLDTSWYRDTMLRRRDPTTADLFSGKLWRQAWCVGFRQRFHFRWILKDVAKDIIECSKPFIFYEIYEARAWLYTTGTKKSQSKKLWCL